jgi:transketolase
MRKQFVKSLSELLSIDEKTILVLGDIGVFGFRNEFASYPERVYNIGILEQSTISLSAGLSAVGLIPFVHTIAPFIVERGLEQLKIDFGYQGLNGNFITIGNSYDYSSLGPTHHCPGDVQLLLTIPNMEIIVPGTSNEFDLLLKQTYNDGNPTYFRLSEYENEKSYDVKFGKAKVIKKGKLATIVCVGNMLDRTIKACENLDVTILYYTTVNPFDTKTLQENLNENLILIEPYYKGGLNFKINECLNGNKYRILNIGVPHNFLTNYGKKIDHDKNFNLDVDGIKSSVEKFI